MAVTSALKCRHLVEMFFYLLTRSVVYSVFFVTCCVVTRSIRVLSRCRLESASVPTAGSSQVVVKILAAPVSELDAAVAAGRASGTVGNEGVGVVTQVGSGVSDIAVNDWVVPTTAGAGTFAEYIVADASNLAVVPNDIQVSDAAHIGGTGATALRILSDYGASGSVIQNNANSAVGQAVVQIAKSKGIKTINIIPDGPDADDVVKHLYGLGADIVVTESYAESAKFGPLVSDLPTPTLGINGAGGKSATSVARAVGDGKTVVTYGGSAPVQVPTSVLVGKGVNLTGFSLARWSAGTAVEGRRQLASDVAALVQDGALKASVEETTLTDAVSAVESFNDRNPQSVTSPLVTV